MSSVRILCALDFSEANDRVLQEVFLQASRLQGYVTILASYRIVSSATEAGISAWKNEMKARVEHDYRIINKKIKALGVDVPYDFQPEIGFVSNRIEAFISKHTVALLIMGEALAEAIGEHKGLTITNFVKSMSVPVIIVPENQPEVV